MPSCLVIGGSRNLGPDLVRALLARGDRVTVLNRGITAPAPAGVTHLTCDRSDRSALTAALRGRDFDVVVDTTLYTGLDAVAAREILDGHAGKYVFWSTGQVYLVRQGPVPPFRETDFDGPIMPRPPETHPVDLDNWNYGIGKRDAEGALRIGFQARRFPYVSLRMPMINSANDHYRRLDAYVGRMLRGEPIVVPDDQPSLRLRHVSGDDVVAATLRAVTDDIPAGTCVNISQDESLDLPAMLQIIADALGTSYRLEMVPRAQIEPRLPGASPWSGRWMSVLDNAKARGMGLRFASPREYLPPLVAISRRRENSDAK